MRTSSAIASAPPSAPGQDCARCCRQVCFVVKMNGCISQKEAHLKIERIAKRREQATIPRAVRYARLLTEIRRRRKENREKELKRGWSPEPVSILIQNELLDWIESQLEP